MMLLVAAKTAAEDRVSTGIAAASTSRFDEMAAPVDTVPDPVFVLEGCLRDRSSGTMVASLRDVWRMAKAKSFAGSYQDAQRLLAETGRYCLFAGIGEPIMVRPKAEPIVVVTIKSDSPTRLEFIRPDFRNG
jgi:hypothetical protein